MSNLIVQAVEKKFASKKVPVLRPGYTVKIHQKIREGEKERIQIFEGLVLGLNSGLGASKMVTVRKIVEGIGVEKIFPLYSPVVAKIEVIKTPKVRRAKLFYMRGLAGKSTRLRAKIGMAEKDEKYSNKKNELLEGMGVDLTKPQEAPVQEEVLAETTVTEVNNPVTTETEKKA